MAQKGKDRTPDDVREKIRVAYYLGTQNQEEIGREYGISQQSVSLILRSDPVAVSKYLSQRTEELRDIAFRKGREVLLAISPEKIKEASLRDMAVAGGILIDKNQLLSGQPTERVLSKVSPKEIHLTLVQVVQELQRRGLPVEESVHARPLPTTYDDSEGVEDAEIVEDGPEVDEKTAGGESEAPEAVEK